MEIKDSRQSGFSLIELVIVVVVIAIIATIAVSNYRASIAKSNEASAVSATKLIHNAEVQFLSTRTRYGNLGELRDAGYLQSDIVKDDSTVTTTKSGYEFKTLMIGDDFVLSAIPVSSSGPLPTGRNRYGSSSGNAIVQDKTVIDQHYATLEELTTGTSEAFNPN